MSSDRYVPALGFERLTRLYDPVLRLTTRETTFRRRLLDQAQLRPGDSVLDLGCGTGTLAVAATEREPRLEMVGIDGDPAMLQRARAKAAAAGAHVDFDEGLSDALPYAESSFDAVLSSLFFHHVTRAVKERTAREIARVLRPGGTLHVLDWGRPRDPLTRARFLGVQLFDGFETTRDTVTGALPQILAGAGLADVREHGRLQAAFGVLNFWSARRS
ncbi:MAG: class I SAM-dependent methyltransferase [Solirubrobacterales bacterium]|nr:class I SAM-dependent methyltransferase [Solirubrobacterales bacterium]